VNAFLADKGVDFLIGVLGGFSVVAIGWFFTAGPYVIINLLGSKDHAGSLATGLSCSNSVGYG